MPVRFYPKKIDGGNNRSHSLSAQILASRLLGLDLGPLDDGLRRLSCLIAQWEIISRHLSDVDALSLNILAAWSAGYHGSVPIKRLSQEP